MSCDARLSRVKQHRVITSDIYLGGSTKNIHNIKLGIRIYEPCLDCAVLPLDVVVGTGLVGGKLLLVLLVVVDVAGLRGRCGGA